MAIETENRQSPGNDSDAESDAVSVTLHLRASPSSAGARRQQAVLDRLRALESSGTLPDLTVERWGAKVTVPIEAADDSAAVALFEEFAAVADEHPVRLEPFFEHREAVEGLLSTGPPTDHLVIFPVVCLTVRRDDELTGLYPCWLEGEQQRVEDAIDGLADGGTAENL